MTVIDLIIVLPFAQLAVGGLLAYLAITIVYRIYFHPLANIPGPPIACITDLYAVYYQIRQRNHYNLYHLHSKYGFMVRYGPNKISFNSASAIKDIYSTTKPLKKSAGYNALILKGTAISSFSAIDKIVHGRKRRILGYGFSDTALKSYEPIVQERINKFCNVLTKDAETHGWGQAKNISRLCACLTFDVMAALVFGRPFNILEDEKGLSYIVDAVTTGGKSAGVFLQLPIFGKNRILFKFRALFRLLFLSISDLMKIKNFLTLSAKMAEERTQREAAKAAGEDVEIKGVPSKDIFSYILSAKDPETGQPFTPEELWVEARVLIVAGSDTTSTAMSGALYYLTRNPVMHQRLLAELKSKFASEDNIKPGPELNSCIYLKNFIEETLRKSPPVGSALWRETMKDHAIEGIRLPAGTEVGVPIYAVHHNERYFPNPHVFNPDRWDESVVGQQAVADARSAWLSFQTGSRSCIGRPLAMLELTLLVARIVYSFEIKVEETKRGVGETTIVPEIKEFETLDQLTAFTTGPFLRFRKRDL